MIELKYDNYAIYVTPLKEGKSKITISNELVKKKSTLTLNIVQKPNEENTEDTENSESTDNNGDEDDKDNSYVDDKDSTDDYNDDDNYYDDTY